MAEVVLSQVTKTWGPTPAVNGISFTARAGELLVLLGPSGCGKSTTLRLVAGLEEVSGGTIRMDDRDVTHLPPAARRLSMVFQSYALFPHLTVAENIVFGLRVRRVPADERRRRLARVADLLGLTELLHRKPAQLSGGQQQRVALGRALIAEAPVCLMDEPLSNLDAKLRNAMRAEIRELQQRLGITMLYVTHDQTEAMTMADQIILMREGRLEQSGTPEELYARPETAFAARFIGSPPMNLLRLEPAGAGAVVAGAGGPTVLDGDDSDLLLGVRPEHVALDGAHGVPARVTAVEYLGAESIVSCRAGGEALALRLMGTSPVHVGAEVHLRWEPRHVHLFDVASGRRRDDVGGARDPGG